MGRGQKVLQKGSFLNVSNEITSKAKAKSGDPVAGRAPPSGAYRDGCGGAHRRIGSQEMEAS